MSVDLFQPYRIGKMELKNRFVRSPLGDLWADDTGKVTDVSLDLYKKFAQGGVGLIEAGHAAVSPHAQLAPRGAHRIDSDSMIPGWRRVVQVAHQYDAKIALQLNHAGGSSDGLMYRGTTLAVSSTPLLKQWCLSPHLGQPHRVMTGEEIELIIDAFVSAARRAVEAGFDAISIGGGAGRNLFGQFLSPLFNLRTDEWGGGMENRRRFALEVVRRTRQAVGPDFPILTKGGLKENREGGLSLDDVIETMQQIVALGINAIEVYGRGTSTGGGPVYPGSDLGANMGAPECAYSRADAAALKRVVSVPVILNGGMRSLELAQAVVNSSDADMISFGRPFNREPDLIARWQSGNRKPARCIWCDRCWGIAHGGQRTECGEEARLRDQSGI